jgi:hypothetical protein
LPVSTRRTSFCFVLRHDSRPNSFYWRRNRRLVQDGKQPALPIWALVGPRVDAGCGRVSGEIEDRDRPVPYGLAVVLLVDRNGLDKGGGAAVLRFDGFLSSPVAASVMSGANSLNIQLVRVGQSQGSMTQCHRALVIIADRRQHRPDG